MKKKSTVFFIASTIFIFSLVIFLTGSNAPFISTGEPREAIVAQSMIINQDLLSSVRYSDELATKPPLLHWCMVAAAKLTNGLNEVSARLPSIVSASIAVTAWCIFLIPLIGFRSAILTFAILTSSAEWFRHASHARVDMLLAANISLALILIFNWIQKEKFYYLLLSVIFLIGAALTKGPVGVAIPILITCVSLIYWKKFTFNKFIQLGLIACISILPLFTWYLAVNKATHGNLFDIIVNENIGRLLGNMNEGTDAHRHGFFYLFGAFFTGLLPWSLFIVPFLPKLWKRLKLTKFRNTDPIIQWCAISVIICFFLFLIPSSKRGVYLLPCYPAMAALLAVTLNNFISEATKIANKTLFILIGLFFCFWMILVIFKFQFVDFENFTSSAKALNEINFYKGLFSLKLSNLSYLDFLQISLPILFILASIYSFRKNSKHVYLNIAFLIILFLAYAKFAFVLPATEKLSPKYFVASEIYDHKLTELSMFESRMYSEVFYARQVNPHIMINDISKDSKYVLGKKEDMTDLEKQALYLHTSPYQTNKPGQYLELELLN